jgi:hypothetical protein
LAFTGTTPESTTVEAPLGPVIVHVTEVIPKSPARVNATPIRPTVPLAGNGLVGGGVGAVAGVSETGFASPDSLEHPAARISADAANTLATAREVPIARS